MAGYGFSVSINKAFSDAQKVLEEKLKEALQFKETDDEIKSQIATVSAASIQFDISDDLTDQIGHTDNRFTITKASTFYPASLKVYYNGSKQIEGKHYEITGMTGFRLLFTPQSLGMIEAVYVPIDMGNYNQLTLNP